MSFQSVSYTATPVHCVPLLTRKCRCRMLREPTVEHSGRGALERRGTSRTTTHGRSRRSSGEVPEPPPSECTGPTGRHPVPMNPLWLGCL